MGYLGHSCGKPQMDMFLGPLVEDLAQLHVYRRGIEITMESTALTTKIMMIVTTIYLQARAYVIQMTQHNGEYGCLFCLEAGEVVKSGKGNYRSYPYREVNPEPRTINNIQADACKATTSEKRIYGINFVSVLSCLSYFDMTKNGN
jgi:hypothetical protein